MAYLYWRRPVRQSRCQMPGEATPSTVLLRSKPHS
eukprot:COSAG04_NODE_21938_length_364_cov_0.977358_1_plen_34_part_10